MPVYKQGVEDSIKSSLLTTIGDIIAASAVSTPARIAAPASGQVLTGQGAGVLPVWAAGGAVTLLKANSGTSTTTTEHDVDTLAISGLAVGDILVIITEVRQITQSDVGGWQAHNTTDTVVLANITNSQLLATNWFMSLTHIMQSQESTTNIHSMTSKGAGTLAIVRTEAAVTTAWTGSWTLGFRSLGQTSGGTHQWRWSVYKYAAA